MGFPCGVLIALIADLVRANPRWDDAPSGATRLVLLAVGWAFATWVLLRGVDGVGGVMRRGFLFGAAEWIIVGICISIFGRVAPGVARPGVFQENASWEPAAPAIVSDIASRGFMGSVTTALAVVCLTGWAVAFIGGRMYDRHVARQVASAATGAAVTASTSRRPDAPGLSRRRP